MRRLILYGLIVSLLGGCNPDDGSPPPETLVVDGLVYTGQTVQVKLAQLAQLNGPPKPYTDAPVIAIRSQEQNFPLFPDLARPGSYVDPSNVVPLVPGEGLVLFIPIQDTLVAASTEVPFPPENMLLDRDIVPLNALDLQTENADTLRWLNPEKHQFTAKLTLVDPNPVKVIPGESDPDREFILAVTGGDHYAIPHKSLRYYGIYRLVLYAVNSEYALFFATNEPSQIQQQTNIINGLGIFTAINSDTTYFFVVPR